MVQPHTRPGFDTADGAEDEYVFTLPDGVTSRFRYSAEGTALVRIPSRQIVEKWSVRECTQRVLEQFQEPHQKLQFDAPGRAAFLGYQTLLNVKANAAAQAR